MNNFQQLINSLPDPIIVVNASGRIVFVNQQVEARFVFEKDELIGSAIEILVPKRFRAAHPEHHARYLSAPRKRAMGTGMDLPARRKDGSESPADIALSPAQLNGETFVIAVVRDMTRQKQGERRLKALHDVNLAVSSALDLHEVLGCCWKSSTAYSAGRPWP